MSVSQLRWILKILCTEILCSFSNLIIVIKADVDPSQRKISKEEAIQFCNRKFLKYIETSAIEHSNIYEAFEMIVREIIESNFIEGMKSKLKDQDTKYISSRSSRNKHSCNIL